MTQTFITRSVITESLPKLCNKAGCLNDRVPGTRFCKDHPPKERQKAKKYKGKPSSLEGVYLARTTLYFVLCKDAGAVKIGITDNLKLRFLNLQGSNPMRLEIITHFGCPTFYEEKVHELLSDHRIRGEWFRMEGRVLELIKDIGNTNQEKTLKRILYEHE